MKNIRSTGFKLLIPTIIALSLSACGGGGGGSSAENVAAPVAPTLTFTDPQSTWDLANYTQTGSCALQVGDTDNGDPNLFADEASGVTYNKTTGSLFVVGDGGTAVVEVNKNIAGANCTTIGSMTLKDGDFADTEGITYDATSNKFVLVEERLRQVDQFTYTAGGTLTRADASAVVLGSTVTNVGIEGVSFDPKTNGYIAVRQSQPTSIFQATINFGAAGSSGTATGSDGNPITVATANPPFLFDAAKTGLSAFNDVFALSNIVATNAPDYADVMIIGAPDGKIVKMDRTGKLLSSLSMSTTAQNEGMTMAPDGTIYVVGEQAAGPSLPGMTVFTPTKDSSSVGIGSNLYLTFDQPVTAGSGDIVISNGTDTRTISVTDTSQVTFNGKVAKIDPKVLLHPSTTYSITYAAGAIKGVSANASAASGTSLSFTTVTGTLDTTAPTLNSTAPVNSAAGISGSHFTLFFDKAVQAGAGNIVITNTNDASDTRTISISDKTQIKFNGGRVTVTLTTPLKDSASYSVQIDSGVVTDLSGNEAAGIVSGTLNFTTAAAGAPAPTILITEVNSNAKDKFDFFELYNYGTAPVDLTGWKWGDGHGDVNDPNNTAAFATGQTILPGKRLVIVSAVSTDLATFKNDWGGLAGVDAVAMVAVGNASTIGLGGGDAVIVYDANGNIASAFNYGPALEAVIGSGDYVSVPRANGTVAADDGHAGPSVGGATDGTSAVWDGASTSNPNYIPAVLGVNGAVNGSKSGTVDSGTIGSPGQ